MSLLDCWENIKTPGFLSASFDELKEICSEFKNDVREWVEEGEELFTDGCMEILIHKNNSYQSSIDKRAL